MLPHRPFSATDPRKKRSPQPRSIRVPRHCCPVNAVLALRARISAGFEAKMHGVDLNWMEHFSEFPRTPARPCSLSSWTSCHGYFHADRRPVWRRSPGPNAFLRRAIPVHGLPPADLPGGATSRPASRSTHRNSITWASASRSGARRWPMPTKGATRPCGVGPAAHHPGEDAVRRRRTGVGPVPSTPWTRRPSLCACRSFRGRTSACAPVKDLATDYRIMTHRNGILLISSRDVT